MFEKVFLPVAVAILIAALSGLISLTFEWMKNNATDKTKRTIRLLSISFIGLAILVLVVGLVVIPSLPANLSAQQTSIASTSTEIANLIQGTQNAAQSTQRASGTQTTTVDIALAEQATATYSAIGTQVVQQVKDNAVLCKYATNPEALEIAANSQRILLWPLVISLIAFVIFFIVSYFETKLRSLFIVASVLALIGLVVSINSYTNHPLAKLPQGFSFSSTSSTNQLLLEECARQQNQQVNSTQTAIALLTAQVAQTETQSAIQTVQANDLANVQTATAIAHLTATQTSYEDWYSQHQFVDDFFLDQHGWSGDDETSRVKLDRSNTGVLIFESKAEGRISFWTCDLCIVPDDHQNYSFEFKYLAPEKYEGFTFGFLFGCDQFDDALVSCQGIKIIEKSQILIVRTGSGKVYDKTNVELLPNAKGFVNIRWEVVDQKLKLWVNEQLTFNNVEIDGPAGGVFGIYADPTGSTVQFERIDINPIP